MSTQGRIRLNTQNIGLLLILNNIINIDDDDDDDDDDDVPDGVGDVRVGGGAAAVVDKVVGAGEGLQTEFSINLIISTNSVKNQII